jgi:hypothetical protein
MDGAWGWLLGERGWTMRKDSMQPSVRQAPVLDESKRGSYPYLRGLDHLRALSGEAEVLAKSLAEIWRSSAVGKDSLAVCDFGCGFGDLTLGILSHLRPTEIQNVTVDLIDKDQALADSARCLLERQTGVRAVASTPDHLFTRGGSYDLILASHVLYYVADRGRLITSLLDHIAWGGTVCFVLRAEQCDTFKIRSAVRSAEGPCAGPASQRVTPATRAGPASQRVTPATVVDVAEAYGASASVNEIELNVEMDFDGSELADAFSRGPVSLGAEMIRLLAHLPASGVVTGSVKARLEDELCARREGRILRLKLIDSIVVVRAA